MGCPKGWLDYQPIGKVIPSTRIVAFKTPLKRELHNETSSDPTQDRFTPQDCMNAVRRCSNGRKKLGLVLNLTFTTKYYNSYDFERSGVHYGAIMCPGHEIPNDELFRQFQRSLYNFFFDYPDRNTVVGVHCTHGVNRTGYMIARFLIQCEGWDVEEAITTVGDARGYPIERENYLSHLNNLHMPSHIFPKVPTAKDLKEKEEKQRKRGSRNGKRDSSNWRRNGDASESSSKGIIVIDSPADKDNGCQIISPADKDNDCQIINPADKDNDCQIINPADKDNDCRIISPTTSKDRQNNSGASNHIQSSEDQNVQGTASQNNNVTERETDEKSNTETESETYHISETDKVSAPISRTIQSSDEEDGFIPLNATSDRHSNSETERSSKKLRTS